MKQFSEATRVQMPAMVHLTRIGYTYFGKLSEDKNGTVYDGDTNILLQVFERQFKNLNPGHEGVKVNRMILTRNSKLFQI